MGGGSYDRDVVPSNRQTTERHFAHSNRVSQAAPEERKCHPQMNIKGKDRECCDSAEHPATTPIAVVMDVSRSRGEDALTIYEKMPRLVGKTVLKALASDPTICVIAFGDATCDNAPLQVGQFEAGAEIDNDLGRLWLEQGGGGTGQESAELIAYYLARHTKLDCLKRGQKGILFITTDEGFYPQVDRLQVKKHIGDDLPENLLSANIFHELQQKYDVFVILPQKPWQERRADIDEEIRQRVKKAGGMVEGVDIRFSLAWNNRNDLDLHVKTPSGAHIYFGDKHASCGGFLDVDMNVHGESTTPVENTRWAKGSAPKGEYKVWVENYGFHERTHEATKFVVEIEINGAIHRVEGTTPKGCIGHTSAFEVGTFFYDPSGRVANKEHYAGYDDTTIANQWSSVVPPERVLKILDPRAMVDVQLGVLALWGGAMNLEEFLADLKVDEQSDERIQEVKLALTPYAEAVKIPKVELPAGATATPKGKARPRTKRI